MGLRFHKSFPLWRGARVNVSKSGPSLSVGRPGARYNLSDKGSRVTLGLPGTGLSYVWSRRLGRGKWVWILCLLLFAALHLFRSY